MTAPPDLWASGLGATGDEADAKTIPVPAFQAGRGQTVALLCQEAGQEKRQASFQLAHTTLKCYPCLNLMFPFVGSVRGA